MAFIEINHNTIHQTVQAGGGFEWLRTLLSVAGGFILKTAYDSWQKRKVNKTIVEEFELQLFTLKDSLRKQIAIVRERRRKLESHDVSNITIYFTNKFERIKSLSWLTLANHYKKTKGKKEGSAYVGKIHNQLDILLLEIERLAKGIYTYLSEQNTFVDEYKKLLDIVRRHHSVHADSLLPAQLKEDKIFQRFVDLNVHYIHGKPITSKFILSLKDTFHKELFEPPFDRNTSPLYQHVFDFNARARDLISKFEWKEHDFKTVLRVVDESLTSIYKDLYQEEFIEGEQGNTNS